VIEVHGVGHEYSSRRVLDGVDFKVDSGEMVALTGPSGTGKSTLLFIVGLLLRPSEGRIDLCGDDASSLDDRSRARLRAETCGFLFQDACLDPTRSILDNVTEPALYHSSLTRIAVRKQAVRLLESFGVIHRAAARPTQISGGQAQRIALCRALVHDPAIVIADEPTGNLDRATAQTVLAELRRRTDSGVAAIVATHDEGVIALCDREIRLR
jgi:ABC-type lipoprotein export system ATPase subunit